ncbi:MAG: rod shape-determining protein MreC [Candidatus Paceibacterota bacterium]|jgi:cell shape-determining protein MreC
MSYLLDRKLKRKKTSRIILIIFILLFLIYFRASIFNGLSYVAHLIFRPILIIGNNIGGKISDTGSTLRSKKSLIAENENLKNQILQSEADRANYSVVVDENLKLKEILERSGTKEMILSAILSKPNQSLYDTLIIDVGENQGILVSQRIFALGNIPIGRIAEVYANSSKVILYSNPGEKTEVVIAGKPARNADGIATAGGDAFMQVIGRGGGNFEMILPRDFVLENETEVHLPGITPYILGVVKTIISDPRDSFQKALLVSPINIQELKFVEVEK